MVTKTGAARSGEAGTAADSDTRNPKGFKALQHETSLTQRASFA
jgi:hypothetical protein